MRKSKLVSVRVPVDVLDKLDVLLKNERFITRSDVICTMLEIAADTLSVSQLEALSHVSGYWKNPVVELHIKFNVYGRMKEIHFVDESQKSAGE